MATKMINQWYHLLEKNCVGPHTHTYSELEFLSTGVELLDPL